MLLTHTARRGWRSWSCLWLVLALALAQLHPAQVQAQAQLPPQSPASASDPQAPQQGGITLKTCEPQVICFRSKEARQQWAQKNQCKFLEDVCEGTPPGQDNQGAKDEDKGFWGDLWDSVKTGLVYGYEFVKGLMHGLKEQVTDLWEAVSNPGEVISGLIELGKAFFNDPAGTLKALAEMLGQEAIDDIKRATQCGAYDLGKVLGKHMNPGVVIKFALKLVKYAGKLAEAVRHTKKDMGCTSFAAGTLVLTPKGMVPIEQIRAGQQVHSRHDRLFIDAPQTVTKTFTRTAPGYRLLTTEFDLLKLTDEHPLWVQGKGWTQAQHITDDDVIAGANGDVRVLDNEPVKQALAVYNFSVAKTANYFVGEGATWAHNTYCDLSLHSKPWEKLTSNEKGFRGEWTIFNELIKESLVPVGNSFDPRKYKNPTAAYKAWVGQHGIDGIYKYRAKVKVKNADGVEIEVEQDVYVIIESKATGGTKNGMPDDTVEGLTKNKDGDRQMSDIWLHKNLENMGLTDVEKKTIIDGLKNNQVKRIYAQTDPKGTTYHEINAIDKAGERSTEDARVSNVQWNPQSLKELK